jgi:hypothetical protein
MRKPRKDFKIALRSNREVKEEQARQVSNYKQKNQNYNIS